MKVMLDSDLAILYKVPTKVFNQAIRRNRDRFPNDFMFQLSKEETLSLRSQIVTLKKGRGHYSKYSSFVFTEQGVAMLASILKSKRAIHMSIAIVRAFIKLREVLSAHKDVIIEIEKMKKTQKEHGENIDLVMRVINKLISSPPQPPKEPIGFRERNKD